MMRTVELWQRWFLLRWRKGCSSLERFRQASLERSCQSPQVQDETDVCLGVPSWAMNPVPLSISIITTTSFCSLVVKTRGSICVIEQLDYALQPILFQVIREAFELYAVYVAGYLRKHDTSFATTWWTMCAVAMKGLQRVRTTA